jgi:phosphoheptose isomerase
VNRRRCVALDRDGTIIAERHYLSDPQQVELIPGAAEGLRQLREMGLALAVVTNQSGIGRGLFDAPRLDLVHRRMIELLESAGVRLDGIYYCPHVPEDDCACRKPRTGLLERAREELGFDFETAFVVGDKAVDIQLGRRVGATTLLVRTGYGSGLLAEGPVSCDYVVDDLKHAAQVIARLLEDEQRPVSDPGHLDRARRHLLESAEIKRQVAERCAEAILSGARLITSTFRSGGKVLLCGNGGSAADCQHMAAEFVSRLTKEFARPALPAIALTTDSSFLTAFTNDCGFEDVFSRQVEALGKPQDVLIGISTSGGSANVIRAVDAAHRIGMRTIALTGSGGRLRELANVCISVPSTDTQYIQESHLAIEHVLCELVERSLFTKGGPA